MFFAHSYHSVFADFCAVNVTLRNPSSAAIINLYLCKCAKTNDRISDKKYFSPKHYMKSFLARNLKVHILTVISFHY